jgi:hypothetical protein
LRLDSQRENANNSPDEASDDESSFDIDFDESGTELGCVNKVGKLVESTDKDYELMTIIQRAHRRGLGYNYRNTILDSGTPRVAHTMTLCEDDFSVDEVFNFRDTGFEVKMYSPMVFQQIRACLDIEEVGYFHALNGNCGSFTKIGTPGTQYETTNSA